MTPATFATRRRTTIRRPAPAESFDDAALLEGLSAGDESAYEALVRQYAGRLLAVARRFLRCEADADDAVQDTFLSAFRALGSFRRGSCLGTWLHRIVVNACLAKLRVRRRRPETSLDLLPAFDEAGRHTAPVSPWSPRADDALSREETRAQVRACIDRLPESYRTVLLLRDIEALDTKEAARALGSTPAAVKTSLHRARQALRHLLEPFRTGGNTVNSLCNRPLCSVIQRASP
jgi:RNA polymerase sigma-70 factor (ECF subfamily)